MTSQKAAWRHILKIALPSSSWPSFLQRHVVIQDASLSEDRNQIKAVHTNNETHIITRDGDGSLVPQHLAQALNTISACHGSVLLSG